MRLYQKIFLCSLFFISIFSLGNNQKLDLSSPKKTFDAHFFYLKSENYKPEEAVKCFDFSENYTTEEQIKIAVKLKQVYKGCGYFIDVQKIPTDINYLDTATNEHVFKPIPNLPLIKIQKYNTEWLYSQETVQHIEELHKKTFPFGTDKLIFLLPNLGTNEFLGLKTWQYVALTIIILLSFLFQQFVILFFKYFKIKRLQSIPGVSHSEFVKKIIVPLSWLVVFGFSTTFLPMIQLPVQVAVFFLLGLKSSIPILVTLTLYRIVDLIAKYFMYKAEQTESKLDDQLVPIIRKSLKLFVVVLGILYLLQHFNINITTLIAGLSIGGLAFALAAQDTIKNFFGSVMIFLDRPFQIGDWIISTGIDGNVEEVGFRATRVRTFANSLVYVPNGKLSDMVIDNLGKRSYRRYKTVLSVQYDTPPYLIELFIEGLRKIILTHPQILKENYHVYLHEYNVHSLDILFYAFFTVPNWSEELKARHEVNIGILKLAKTLGVKFAFPTQTLHMNSVATPTTFSSNYPTEIQAKEIYSTYENTTIK